MRTVNANVNFVGSNRQMQGLNFTIASSCPKYQTQVEAEHHLWDWEKMVVNNTELERMCFLGKGSFATVTRVRWKGNLYALKSFNTQAWTQRRRGFPYAVRREVSILAHLASLGHPHVCKLVGLVMDPQIALLFEICEGDTLYSCIHESGRTFTWHQRFLSLKQIAEALVHLHENQLIHRDLKSNNVLFLAPITADSDPHVKVTDVGLARWVLEDDDDDADNKQKDGAMTPLTGAGVIDWHAPELTTGFYGASVDIFAFGVLLVEVILWTTQLPDAWKTKLSSFQDAQQPSLVTTIALKCIAASAERPAAVRLRDELSEMKEVDSDRFNRVWSANLNASANAPG
jgi:serine/threonine protein kinase